MTRITYIRLTSYRQQMVAIVQAETACAEWATCGKQSPELGTGRTC